MAKRLLDKKRNRKCSKENAPRSRQRGNAVKVVERKTIRAAKKQRKLLKIEAKNKKKTEIERPLR